VVHRPSSHDTLALERANGYDVVILSRRHVAERHIDQVRRSFPRALIVFDTVDLQHVRERRRLALFGGGPPDDGSDYETLLRSETALIRQADVVAAVSEDERRIVEAIGGGVPTIVLPTVHEAPSGGSPGFEAREHLLFIGYYEHLPNVDAVLWFAAEILPLVRARIPVRFDCMGSLPPQSVRELQSAEIFVPGQLHDVEPWFQRARVFVAPLRYGAGTKGKVGHAMAMGVPVVTTSIGAEGFRIEDGVHALVRDDAEGFADAVIELYTNRRLWESIADAARRLISSTMGPEMMRRRLAQLIEPAAARQG
jgi:glycosyltransferase involved in cell wall biosynthesis